MPYLNPYCARCMARNGLMWHNYCRRWLAERECTDKERELIQIQDLQKMPIDKYGKLKTHLPYTKTWYF